MEPASIPSSARRSANGDESEGGSVELERDGTIARVMPFMVAQYTRHNQSREEEAEAALARWEAGRQKRSRRRICPTILPCNASLGAGTNAPPSGSIAVARANPPSLNRLFVPHEHALATLFIAAPLDPFVAEDLSLADVA
jgi:hypothetical protein